MKSKIKKTIKFGLSAVSSPKKTAGHIGKKFKKHQTNVARQQQYKVWINKHVESIAQENTSIDDLKYKPLISIILPIYNTPEGFLRECIDSVLNQSYPNWELCVADDASTTNIIDVVKSYSKKHANIKWVRLEQNVHIAESSNAALKLAKGEFVALLDHDDLLEPFALLEVVKVLNKDKKVDFVYSDEDKIEAGIGRLEPFFKPDWSPDFLRSCNYITHFSVLRHSVVKKIGGFRKGTEGAQDWDLFLRFTRETDRIMHISKILYSWRKSPTSTAKVAKSKPYAYINQRRVLRDAIKDVNIGASVYESEWLGFWRVKYHINDNPKISIVVPTKNNLALIQTCLESIIEKTTYANFEVVVVDTGSTDTDVNDFYASKFISTNPIKIVRWDKPFNFSAACNLGATHADGTYLVFLNNDTEVISCDWLEGMLEHAQRKEVGVVGCKLLFPDDTIQHAGVVLSDRDIAFHPFYESDPSLDIFTNIYISNIRNCSAVTAACCMVRREIFDLVGGFDEALRVTYNDVDFCLRVLEKGYDNVYTPFSSLYHYESKSIGKISTTARDTKELDEAAAIMRKRWSHYLKHDPFYNDNFEQHGPGYRLPQ